MLTLFSKATCVSCVSVSCVHGAHIQTWGWEHYSGDNVPIYWKAYTVFQGTQCEQCVLCTLPDLGSATSSIRSCMNMLIWRHTACMLEFEAPQARFLHVGDLLNTKTKNY